jgi:hypothetical protein
MQIYMLVLGGAYLAFGFIGDSQINLAIGNIWIVGSIIYGKIK